MSDTIPILQEIKLTYKTKINPSQRPTASDSQVTSSYFRQIWDESSLELFESFHAIYLNRSNKVLGWNKIGQGGITGTTADIRLILATALKSGAVGVIIAHNHPSGNLNPSTEDRALTRKLIEGAKLLELVILDHLIITSESYYSFADDGLMTS